MEGQDRIPAATGQSSARDAAAALAEDLAAGGLPVAMSCRVLGFLACTAPFPLSVRHFPGRRLDEADELPAAIQTQWRAR